MTTKYEKVQESGKKVHLNLKRRNKGVYTTVTVCITYKVISMSYF